MTEIEREEPLIEAHGIAVRFGRHSVLTGIDVTVWSGEVVTLIGPNGAGKTTLVRVLLGLIRPHAGTVRRRAHLVVGYVPQRFAIDPVLPLSVRELLRLTERPSETAMREALKEVGAEALIGQRVQDLSGGELQRVLLARALLRRPQLLVLDEPIQGVDFAGQLELYDLITSIRTRARCGVLMISHDLHVVMGSTDRVLCINHHLCCSGHPEDVRRHPEYLALFGALPTRNVAVYTHAHDHRHDLHGEVVPVAPDGDDPHRAHSHRHDRGHLPDRGGS